MKSCLFMVSCQMSKARLALAAGVANEAEHNSVELLARKLRPGVQLDLRELIIDDDGSVRRRRVAAVLAYTLLDLIATPEHGCTKTRRLGQQKTTREYNV